LFKLYTEAPGDKTISWLSFAKKTHIDEKQISVRSTVEVYDVESACQYIERRRDDIGADGFALKGVFTRFNECLEEYWNFLGATKAMVAAAIGNLQEKGYHLQLNQEGYFVGGDIHRPGADQGTTSGRARIVDKLQIIQPEKTLELIAEAGEITGTGPYCALFIDPENGIGGTQRETIFWERLKDGYTRTHNIPLKSVPTHFRQEILQTIERRVS